MIYVKKFNKSFGDLYQEKWKMLDGQDLPWSWVVPTCVYDSNNNYPSLVYILKVNFNRGPTRVLWELKGSFSRNTYRLTDKQRESCMAEQYS